MSGHCITTFTGREIDPFAMKAEDISIEDIAHALSMTCRFGGHCRSFYSVAEHSVQVASLCPPHLYLDGLLHDAAEAYLGDIPTPLKRTFLALESADEEIYRKVAVRFGLNFPLPEPVRWADEEMLRREYSVLIADSPVPGAEGVPIRCLAPAAAEALFLSKDREVTAPGHPDGRLAMPEEGAVLGVDVGWSEHQRSSAACLLRWSRAHLELRCKLFTAQPDDLRKGLSEILAGSNVLAAAIDGPIRGQLDEIGIYRSAERTVTRQLAKHIGKPGQSSSANGRKLNHAANSVASLLLELGAVGPASHEAAIHDQAIVEAFPTSFLGVMLDSGYRKKGQARSDSYFETLTQGSEDGRLGVLLRDLLPGRIAGTSLSGHTNHDERAAIVCALTALCVVARRYVAVGDDDGYILLPPRAGGARPGLKDWAWALIERNVNDDPVARAVIETGYQS
ncbi:MAG: HD domain-containing protein [Acidobacteria bacterium]|nr:HD domain-containing protein [Acidobacteriota bacterium]